jgi:hypothetical protein
METFCRPVPKLFNTSAKPDGAFLVSGVRGESSRGGGIGLVILDRSEGMLLFFSDFYS